MQPIAASLINDWNRRPETLDLTKRTLGLVAVSFDQRNHGSRLVDKTANEAWRGGNDTHALDMLGIYRKKTVNSDQQKSCGPQLGGTWQSGPVATS